MYLVGVCRYYLWRPARGEVAGRSHADHVAPRTYCSRWPSPTRAPVAAAPAVACHAPRARRCERTRAGRGRARAQARRTRAWGVGRRV